MEPNLENSGALLEKFSRVEAETSESRPSLYPLFPESPPQRIIPMVGIVAGLVSFVVISAVVVGAVIWRR